MNPPSRNPDPLGLGSARPKPRLVKLRKHAASSNTSKFKLFPETGNVDYGFNPFRPTSDISVSELGPSFQSKLNFGDVGDEGFVFGVKTGNVCGFVQNKVVDDLRKLKIEKLDSGNGGDSSRLEEDIRKLKIGDSGFVDSPENQNVRKLPNELMKLDIKDQKEPEISRTNDNSDDNFNTSVHRNTNEGNTSMPGSSNGIFPGKTESVLSIEMERLSLAKDVGNVPSEGETDFNSCSGVNNLFPPKDFTFQTPKISYPSGSIFVGTVGEKIEFNARRESSRDARSKKSRGKLKKPVSGEEDFVSNVNNSFQENQEDSFESYSPMDISPYHESMIDNEEVQRDSRDTSVELEEAISESLSTTVNEAEMKDDLVIPAVDHLDNNVDDAKYAATKGEDCQFGDHGSFDADVSRDDCNSEAETESFVTADVQFDYDSCSDTFVTAADTEVCSTSRTETEMLGSSCGPTSEDAGRTNTNFTFAAATSIPSQSSTSTRHQKKKNRYRVSQELHTSTPSRKIQQSSPSMQFFQSSELSPLLSPRWGQKEVSTPFPKRENKAEAFKGLEIKQESSVIPTAALAAQEACNKWRLRGNKAYASGDMLRAEDYYSQGVNCISQNEKSKCCLRALMLCYSNRAATRMSLGRVSEALGDCRMAADIDPKFLRVQVRAANCYLALGDVENASRHFTACLQSGNDACVDPKLASEASEGLEKSQRVLECMKQSGELMQQRNLNAAVNALRVISEALTLSTYSEKLLELKAEALLMLGKYEELIRLCEQTLVSAERNHGADDASDMESSDALRLWRWRFIIKSYFCLGRLEDVLDFLNKQENSAKIRSTTLESLPLVGIIRQLVSNKGAGNEAFKSGNYVEAIEHYTAALSSTVESRPFAAVCFCNRAAAYKAIGQVIDAIADCSIAIALDGNYLKAISRRASLFEMIRDYDQAAKDLQRVSSLLIKHMEEKAGEFGPDGEINCLNELRHVQQRKITMEEYAKQEIPLNLYLILGVDPFVAAVEIKKAYRRAALRHHPDKTCQFFARSESIDDVLWKEVLQEVHKDADRLFKMIAEAYAILSDPLKRSRYDIDEEMRNAQKKGFGGPRMHTDESAHERESSSNRHQWREVWRPYGNNFQSRGSDTSYRSSRY